MLFATFAATYLEALEMGQEFATYGYKAAGIVDFLNTARNQNQAISIIRMRANKQVIPPPRCKQCRNAEKLWELTTDGGHRFIYYRDGKRLIFFSCSYKAKEKVFDQEVQRAARLRDEYLELKRKLKVQD